MIRFSTIVRQIPLALVLMLSIGLLHASPGTDAFEAGDMKTAQQLLTKEIKASDDVEKRLLLGQIALSEADFEDALSIFEEAAEKHPQNADAQYWIGASSGSLAGNASIFRAAGHAKKARKAFQRTIELDPEHMDGHEGLVMYYLQAPGFLGGDKDEALALAKRSISFSPIDGRLLVAQVYGQTKESEKRQAIFKELTEIAPNDPRAFLNIGFAEQNDKNFAAAHEAFTKATQTTAPGESAEISRQSARYQIGRTAVFSEQRLSDGIAALTAYLQGEQSTGLPSTDWATFRRGQLRQLAGETIAAAQDFAYARDNTEDKTLLAAVKKATR